MSAASTVSLQAKTPGPARIVRLYLDAMEDRDLDGARAWLSPTFTMVFPGGARMTSLEELIAWSRTRYRSIGKTFEAFDVTLGIEVDVVHCHGTLRGRWLDGSEFEGIRFMDRFEVAGGLIRRQDVWNDMGEARLGDAGLGEANLRKASLGEANPGETRLAAGSGA